MTVKEIMARGVEIAKEAAEMASKTPLPADDLFSLYREWAKCYKPLMRQAGNEPIENQKTIVRFYFEVAKAIDLPLSLAIKNGGG